MDDIGLLIFFDKTLYNHCTNFGCSRPHPNGMERIPMASPRRPTTPETWFRDRIYQVLDGHMRLEIAQGATDVPVLVLDVTEDEAALILATHDPIGDLALPDAESSDALARAVWTDNEAINTVLRDLLMPDSTPEGADRGRASDVRLELAPQPYEHYDYIVLLARNTFDFHRLCALLQIERQEFTVPGGAKKMGLGRCVDAAKVIDLLEGHGHAVA